MLVNSDISDDNAIKLIDILGDEAMVEKINSCKQSVISKIITDELSNVNIKYICENFKLFGLKDDFISSLYKQKKLIGLDNESLNEQVMTYILSNKEISTSDKVQLIIIKIKNRADVSLLIKYISIVEEIKSIAEVWSNRYPEINNDYKEKISQELINAKYVKKRRDKNRKRIMLEKS